MIHVTLPAHFDGQQILLDAPYPLEPDTPLLVVVLPMGGVNDEREDWLQSSAAGLARAYGNDEIEYSSALIKEANPEYSPDELISPEDADFPTSGLLAPSLVRLGFLAVIPAKDIPGIIGAISKARHQRLLRRLSEYLVS